ncbi:MAG: UPF0079 ATP-binding protein [Candidatus Berkelbacteria bacterium Licking1014_7]|uniref:tRNA threonylcarbamoyladenosine biosynthesis protein TsaE n=1 Tax=Candidatus Berkelbacteria bacterium Licking1014_7 TaxID=2017147 RepID=A0A554LJF4_9BACT|nr:MAG: UPF0079 ATP-binding protein [Candidatus Berkelbacteria bacterium Licking1014_7]
MQKFIVSNSADAQRIAKKFQAKILRAQLIFLRGDLGSGKTHFVKCLAKVLGIEEVVISPSFQLAKEYKISVKSPKKKLVHIDLYRLPELKSSIDFPELFDYLSDRKNLVIVEWGERAKNVVAPDLIFEFENHQREFSISCSNTIELNQKAKSKKQKQILKCKNIFNF